MLQYDRDDDGKLSWEEFTHMLLPRDPNYASLLSRRGSMFEESPFAFRRETCFYGQTLQDIINLFQQLISNETSKEKIRRKIKKDPEFSIAEGYQEIDTKSKGYIDKSDIKAYFDKQQIFLNERDFQGLMSLFDHNKDNRITFSEMNREL